MATTATTPAPVGPETLISIKITVNGIHKKFKLPLADLVPQVLPGKLRALLGIAESQAALFERFSDSSASYVNLDPSNVHAYRTLYRAAKAKLKLRLRATVGPQPVQSTPLAGINDTLNSLANLNFGSEATLTTIAGPSGSASSSATKLDVPAPEPASAAPDTATVASAIAQSAAPVVSPPVEPVAPVVAESSNSPVSPPTFPHSLSVELAKELKQLEAFKAKLANQSTCTLNFKSHPAYIPHEKPKPVLRMSNPAHLPPGATYSYSVFCNECNKNMLNEHYHCDVCEGGDYDLCAECLAAGKHCLDDNHWLIKRCMRDGKVVNATTETVAPKTKQALSKEMPGAYTEEKKFEEPEAYETPTRTCNCCVKVFNEDAFVTCRDCEDYDLCVPCLEDGKHGHHPRHSFEPVSSLTTLSNGARALCNSGRNVHHSAICDSCNNRIVGVRYKCLNCPDWDYCSSCIRKAPFIHYGHRFAPVYDAIPADSLQNSPPHVGVFCDGPLCKTKNSYITGVRYKCAVCPDIDFCSSCEALPRLDHNRTHPLLKFRTPVRGCSITTLVDEDRARRAEQASTTQICTVAEVKPTESPTKSVKEKIEIKDLLAEPIQEKVPVPEAAKEEPKKEVSTAELQAHFIRDTISDGTTFAPEKQFVQVWTLKNPGPHDWPAGCSVRYVGGDNMLNVDDSRPSSDADFSKATESNIIRRPVKVGEEISFRVLMKAPKREGVAISYWRLKAADGVPFGHRLWCHINVASQPTSPVNDKDTDAREVGRLGSHDAFLRLFLNEQSKRSEQAPELSESQREGLARQQEARLAAMRDVLRQKMKARIMEKYKADNAAAGPSTSKRAVPIKVEDAKPVELAVEPPAAAELSSSKMIFPTLEKESPASSTHEDAVATNAAPAAETVPAVAPANEDAELFEDAESVSLVDDSDDESGFLTEEEYDILDASDEEAA